MLWESGLSINSSCETIVCTPYTPPVDHPVADSTYSFYSKREIRAGKRTEGEGIRLLQIFVNPKGPQCTEQELRVARALRARSVTRCVHTTTVVCSHIYVNMCVYIYICIYIYIFYIQIHIDVDFYILVYHGVCTLLRWCIHTAKWPPAPHTLECLPGRIGPGTVRESSWKLSAAQAATDTTISGNTLHTFRGAPCIQALNVSIAPDMQWYLAHQKQTPSLRPPYDPPYSPTVGS